jgi:hypothetical protein
MHNIIGVAIPLQLLPHFEDALVTKRFSLVRTIADAGYVKPQSGCFKPNCGLARRRYLDLNDSFAAMVEDNAGVPFFLAHDLTY